MTQNSNMKTPTPIKLRNYISGFYKMDEDLYLIFLTSGNHTRDWEELGNGIPTAGALVDNIFIPERNLPSVVRANMVIINYPRG